MENDEGVRFQIQRIKSTIQILEPLIEPEIRI